MPQMIFKPILEEGDISKEMREARWELWRMGDLSWKLQGCQKEMYDAITNQDETISTILASRRTGKSFTALVAEIEVCIQSPFIICKHACPTQKMVKEMIYPQLRIIFQDAPPEFDLESLWNISEGKLKFPNGSMITIAGTDGNNADNLRGTYCHLATCDESGFMDNLDYVVKSILRPQTLTTGGKISLISTPNPTNIAHEFHTKYVFPAEASGKLTKFTIYDNTRISQEDINGIISDFTLGVEDPQFKVEYMVEIPKVTESTIVPEFASGRNQIVTEDFDIPNEVDFYVGGDHGVRDLSSFLFAFYDFKEAMLVVTDEWVGNGPEMTTTTIAEAIRRKEEIRFVTGNGFRKFPTKRVMDNNLQMIADLTRLHGLKFSATKKDNKVAQINNLRVLIEEGRLRIHPRCKNLIYHIEHAKWKKGDKKVFDHLPPSTDGNLLGSHADCLDSLIYLVRNINFNKNPATDRTVYVSEDQFLREIPITNNETLMRALLGTKKRK